MNSLMDPQIALTLETLSASRTRKFVLSSMFGFMLCQPYLRPKSFITRPTLVRLLPGMFPHMLGQFVIRFVHFPALRTHFSLSRTLRFFISTFSSLGLHTIFHFLNSVIVFQFYFFPITRLASIFLHCVVIFQLYFVI